MTTYYISPSGSNSNNGLGPDASHATNKPWLTLGMSMQSGTPVLPGDTVYIAPGYYWNTSITPVTSCANAATQSLWIGDPLNKQGFKTATGTFLPAGVPRLLTRTSASGGISGSNPNSGNYYMFSFYVNDPSGYKFQNLAMEAYGGIAYLDLDGSTDITFEDCFLAGTALFNTRNDRPATAGRNWTVRRSTWLGGGGIISTNPNSASAATPDADLNILIENNYIMYGFIGYSMFFGAATGNLAGGVYVYNNTIHPSYGILQTSASKVSTVTPVHVKGNLILGTVAFIAGTAGQIVDDGYNVWVGGGMNTGVPFTNVTLASSSILGPVANIVSSQFIKWGLDMPRNDIDGWADYADPSFRFSNSGMVTSDFRGRTIRPWSSGSSIGCWQAAEIVKDTTSAITGGGTNSLKMTGAGEVSFYIPIDATATTISIRTKSTSYGGTDYPQMIIVANPTIGVTTDTTVTASDATDQQITSATITPTAQGVMEVRLVSRSTSTTSLTYFDLLTSP